LPLSKRKHIPELIINIVVGAIFIIIAYLVFQEVTAEIGNIDVTNINIFAIFTSRYFGFVGFIIGMVMAGISGYLFAMNMDLINWTDVLAIFLLVGSIILTDGNPLMGVIAIAAFLISVIPMCNWEWI